LLFFLRHLLNLNVHDVIDRVTNRPIDVDSFEFMQLRSKFSDNVRTFKNKTIDRFAIHIDELRRLEI
jgi:hypothetical protein